MTTEPTKPDSTSTEGEKQKQLDREIREMITTLTRRLADLQHVHKPPEGGVSSDHDQDEDDHGLKVITLAGTNYGATMRSDLEEIKDSSSRGQGVSPSAGENEQSELSSYVNSNFQAINNSIMMGGSYSTNDPGVHMDISDYVEFNQARPNSKNVKKMGKKKDKKSPSSSSSSSSPKSEKLSD